MADKVIPAPIAGTTRGYSRYSLAARTNKTPQNVVIEWLKNVAEFITKNDEPAKIQTANSPDAAPYRRNPKTYRIGIVPAAKIGLTSAIGIPAIEPAANTAGQPGGYCVTILPPILKM